MSFTVGGKTYCGSIAAKLKECHMKLVVPFLMITAFAACDKHDDQSKADMPVSANTQLVSKAKLIADIPSILVGQPYVVGGKCALDIVNAPQPEQVFKIDKRDGFKVSGWAYDDKLGVVPVIAVFQLAAETAKFHGVLARLTSRPDVSKATGNPKLDGAGYDGDFDISKVPSGTYEALVIMKTETQNIVCDTYRKVQISD
jgi:hypothetical protein